MPDSVAEEEMEKRLLRILDAREAAQRMVELQKRLDVMERSMSDMERDMAQRYAVQEREFEEKVLDYQTKNEELKARLSKIEDYWKLGGRVGLALMVPAIGYLATVVIAYIRYRLTGMDQ